MRLRNLLLSVMAAATLAASADGRMDALRQKADSLHAAGNNDSALIVAEEALGLARKGGDTTAMVGVSSSMGVYLRTMGRLDDALKRYGEAMKMCTTESFKSTADEDARQEAASLYLNLATLHVDMQHKKEALYYARMAADWGARCKDKELKAQLFAQNGLIFLMCGDNEGAARMLSSSYGMAMEARQYHSALSAAAYMVAVADRSGDAEGESLWRGRCAGLVGKVDDTMTLVAYYQILASVEMNHKRWRGAIALMDKILKLKGVGGMPFVVYDCYNNMHEAWAELGDWHEAYLCLGKAVELKDSLFEADKAESLRSLTVKYQAKEKELALARSEADLAQTRMMLAMAALVVLAGALAVTLYVQRQRRRERERQAEFARLKADTDRRLTQRYIDGLEAERERLAKELHDGVCNDLYTVELLLANEFTADKQSADKLTADEQTSSQQTSGQVISRQAGSRQADEIQADEIQADEANLLVCSSADCLSAKNSSAKNSSAKNLITACREQVRRVSHELMPPEFKYADINIVLDDYIMRTAEAAGRDITYEADPADADWGAVADSAALEMYRITQEAVGNAVKHSDATLVSVSLSMTPQAITLTVADNGSPADFSGSGIGRRTMRQRAEAAGGKLTATREDGKNIIQFTIHNA